MRLIDADTLTDKIGDRKYEITKLKGGYRYCNLEEKNDWDVLDEFESMVDDVPTVDAETVRHGRWLGGHSFVQARCSCCDYAPYNATADWARECMPYCSRCGAKMDEEEKST